MIKKYSKVLTMMLGAFMLFAISMHANSLTTAGTSTDLTYDVELSESYDFSATGNAAYQAGRRVGRKVGAAIGRVAFIADLAYHAVTNYFSGGDEVQDQINQFAMQEDISVFDN